MTRLTLLYRLALTSRERLSYTYSNQLVRAATATEILAQSIDNIHAYEAFIIYAESFITYQ